MELHRGAVGASAPTSSGSAPGFAGADGRNEGRSRTVLTTRSASGPREEDFTRVARLSLRPGMLTDLEESRVKARGGKIKVTDSSVSCTFAGCLIVHPGGRVLLAPGIPSRPGAVSCPDSISFQFQFRVQVPFCAE